MTSLSMGRKTQPTDRPTIIQQFHVPILYSQDGQYILLLLVILAYAWLPLLHIDRVTRYDYDTAYFLLDLDFYIVILNLSLA